MFPLKQDTNKDKDADADSEFKLNWKRVAITSMFGLGFVGPVGHFWFLSFFFLIILLYILMLPLT